MGGRDLLALTERQWRDIRGKDIGMIFQEPMASLNPALTVARQIEEVFELHSDYSRAERAERARRLVEKCTCPNRTGFSKAIRTSCRVASVSAWSLRWRWR